MGAAQHHRVHPAQVVGPQKLLQVGFGPGKVLLLHQIHQTGAGERLGPFAIAGVKRLELGQTQGHGGGQHQDRAAPAMFRGGLEGRLHADDGQGQLLPQVGGGHAGGGVAGNDHGLHVPGHEMGHDCPHIPQHLRLRLGAVGGVEGIAKVDKILPGKRALQRGKHADAAHTAVKHPNGRCNPRHGAVLLARDASIIDPAGEKGKRAAAEIGILRPLALSREKRYNVPMPEKRR